MSSRAASSIATVSLSRRNHSGSSFPVDATETVDRYGERVIRGPATNLREWVEDGFVSTERVITVAGGGRSINLRPVYRGLP